MECVNIRVVNALMQCPLLNDACTFVKLLNRFHITREVYRLTGSTVTLFQVVWCLAAYTQNGVRSFVTLGIILYVFATVFLN